MQPLYYVLMIWGFAAVIALVHYLIRRRKKKLSLIDEKEIYYSHMRLLLYEDYEINQFYSEIKTFDELKRLNRKLEKVLNPTKV